MDFLAGLCCSRTTLNLVAQQLFLSVCIPFSISHLALPSRHNGNKKSPKDVPHLTCTRFFVVVPDALGTCLHYCLIPMDHLSLWRVLVGPFVYLSLVRTTMIGDGGTAIFFAFVLNISLLSISFSYSAFNSWGIRSRGLFCDL